MPLSVEYADLSLAQQVLERQGTHVQNMHSFLDEWGHIVTGGVAPVAVYKTGYGLLLMAFNGLNEIAVQAGLGVLILLENAHTGTANHMGRTIDAYVSADEQIHAALSAATQALGGSALLLMTHARLYLPSALRSNALHNGMEAQIRTYSRNGAGY